MCIRYSSISQLTLQCDCDSNTLSPGEVSERLHSDAVLHEGDQVWQYSGAESRVWDSEV